MFVFLVPMTRLYCNIMKLPYFLFRDLSNNKLTGDVPDNGSFSLFTPIRFIECDLHFHDDGVG